ncbi:MAG: formate dehydrogenase accessory sulfurtransferase FdhD [Hyphomicrobium sp.]
MTDPVRIVQSHRVGHNASDGALRAVPEEVPVALVYDGATQAVMMATPADLEDFALGFSFTEGQITRASDITGLSVVEQPDGIEARMWLVPEAGHQIVLRRRAIAGPTGCGLCGVESLAVAVQPPPVVPGGLVISSQDVHRALAALAPAQELNIRTRAIHAAAFFTPGTGALVVREDVGRHNALDKLVGALLRSGTTIDAGFVVLTSRVSVEMVQKTAKLGAQIIVAVSAPTALAIRTAEAAGITLIAVARADGFEIFSHRGRIAADPINGAGSGPTPGTEVRHAC